MTTYHLLIIADSTIDHTTRFFKIGVGNNFTDNLRLKALQVLANHYNWFFAPYSHEVADFMLRVAQSLSVRPDELNCRFVGIRRFMVAWTRFRKLHPANNYPQEKPTSSKKTNRNRLNKPPQAVLQAAECVRRNKPKSFSKDFCIYLDDNL